VIWFDGSPVIVDAPIPDETGIEQLNMALFVVLVPIKFGIKRFFF